MNPKVFKKKKNFLIEEFFFLPVVHLELRISPWIFEKIWNGHSAIIRKLGETDPCRKPEVKNLVALSFKHIFHAKILLFVTLKSDQNPNPDGLALVFAHPPPPPPDLDPLLARWKARSGSALKPMQIHNTALLSLYRIQIRNVSRYNWVSGS